LEHISRFRIDELCIQDALNPEMHLIIPCLFAQRRHTRTSITVKSEKTSLFPYQNQSQNNILSDNNSIIIQSCNYWKTIC